ncbi:hypothetical protein SAMN05518871_10142 [Psychrobacillus sp. OK028]|uniref:hypothetical protein n=1 Tax=Psychrobacillus sp. OK028 TaxID=1884359 RepID=UPI0008847BEA|nr:hypothetical protein [Psychrobacillus sp. OK028]SDM36373.1 hypothetical protein SAMN05518871_10142 [Psychrobacillus sp. OK028]
MSATIPPQIVADTGTRIKNIVDSYNQNKGGRSLNCTNCGHQQIMGNFCSLCGTEFEELLLNTDNVASRTRAAKPNVHIENIKKITKIYSSYFIQQLKKPSHAYNHGESELKSSLVSIILFTALVVISLFLFSKDLYWSNPPSFISFFMENFLLTFLIIGLVILSSFLISNFFGPQHSFKTIISFYGGQLSAPIILVTASIFLMLVESYTYANTVLTICIVFSLFILPLYIMTFLLSKNPTAVDPLYGFMLYIATFSILLILFVIIVGNSKVVEYFYHMSLLF